MPARAPFIRVLLWTALLAGGALAVAGGLALRGPELVAIGVAGVLAGCMAVGVVRETPGGSTRSVPESAAVAAGGTVLALLVVAGLAVLIGGAAVVLALTGGGLAFLALRAAGRRRGADPATPSVVAPPVVVQAEPLVVTSSDARPVGALSTAELGQEWLRTTELLAARLHPAARHLVVARRGETLDELERRDPAGFGRWLAAGSEGDPAEFVRNAPAHGGRLQADPAADTDAA